MTWTLPFVTWITSEPPSSVFADVSLTTWAAAILPLTTWESKHRFELRLVMGEVGQRRLRHLGEGGVGGGKYGQLTCARDGAGEPGRFHERQERLKLAGGDGRLDDALPAHRI